MIQGISGARHNSPNLRMRVALVCFATLLFRCMLDFLYIEYITRIYPTDFPLVERGAFRVIESYIIVLVLSIVVAGSLYRRWRPSGIVLVLYLVVVIVPLTSQYGFADAPTLLVYAATGSIIVLVAVTELHPRLRIPQPSPGIVYLWLTCLFAMSIYVYGWLIFTGSLERLNFNLLAVYELRAKYVQMRGPFMGYFIPWQGYVINILGLLYALRRRSYWLIGLFAVAQLLLFGMTGHKSFLLAPFLAGGVYLVWQRKNAISWVLIGALLLTSVSYTYFLMTGDEFVPSLLIRRLFFVPARLHILYYDFFSQPGHPFYALSDSILRYLIQNPYGMPMPRVIALEYWGREFWPDVGYLGDAYGNFGTPGMFLFSMVLGLFLRAVDSLTKHLPSHFVAAAISLPAMTLTESALFTSLLTHGFILTALTLWVLHRVKVYRQRPTNSPHLGSAVSSAQKGGLLQ